MHKISQNLRKIIPQGYSRLLSLPLFWLQSVGLEAGDCVELSLGKDGTLVIKPHHIDEEDQDEKGS